MKKQLRRVSLIVLCSLFICLEGWSQASEKDALKVLFVGNSYTYFWNLCQTLEVMSENQGTPLLVRKSTAGGVTWKDHWDGEKELKSRTVIETGDWDVVVLQNHSLSTTRSMEEFIEYGSKFIELVKKNGAKPVLYQTWARENNPLMIDQIRSGYDSLANLHQIDVVRIGEIWQRASQLQPSLRLYDPDGSHPSTVGTYLTAYSFMAYFSQDKLKEAGHRIITTDKNGEVLYLSIQSEETADFLQQVVSNFFESSIK